MNDKEIRSLLGLYRAGETPADARFEEAKTAAENNPELARWWENEKQLDRAIAAKLSDIRLPAGLAARLTAPARATELARAPWRRSLLLAAATIVALAIIFGSWRGPFQPADSLANYRGEMVSFIKLAPALELKSNDFAQLTDFLKRTGAPSNLALPAGLQNAEPIGCRTLRFRGHDVALVCFKRSNGQLAHLFVLPRAALPGLPGKGERDYAQENDWMTAAWSEGEDAYLLMVQGDRADLEKFFSAF
jgi:hypothetical protein